MTFFKEGDILVPKKGIKVSWGVEIDKVKTGIFHKEEPTENKGMSVFFDIDVYDSLQEEWVTAGELAMVYSTDFELFKPAEDTYDIF